MITLDETLEDLGELDACKRLAMRMEFDDMVKRADPKDRALLLEAFPMALAAEDDED